MPFALPFIVVALKPLLIAGAAAIATSILAWSLTSPQGRVTWENITRWIDHNIKQVVEWIAKQAKEGFRKLSWEYYHLVNSIQALIQAIDNKINGVRVYILNYIFSSIWPALNRLAAWRIDVAAWLHNYIEANLVALLQWRVNVVSWLHNYIEKQILNLIAWRVNVSAYIHNVIEKNIQALSFNLHRVAGRLWGLEEWVKTEVNQLRIQGLSIVNSYVATLEEVFVVDTGRLLKDLGKKFAQSVGIASLAGVIVSGLDLVTGKAYKSVEEAFDYADDLMIDDLYIAWMKLTAPVLIGEFKDWTATMQDSFNSITRNV